MNNCSNCFNGCAEIVSDKCVRYTGIDIPQFGISNGDTLSHVEESLVTFLQSALDGTGIKLNIAPSDICALVDSYLTNPGDISALDLFTALIKSTCDLQEQITVVANQVLDIEGNYTVGCLTGVTAGSGTHDILQATITKLCAVDAALTALALEVDTNYVKLADLNGLIQAYLDSLYPIPQQYVKMVPYTAVEYYGPLTNFDAAGKGLVGLGWDKIYLCNGQPGTPDKRGRVGVGAIVGVPGGALADAVRPTIAGNPDYALNSVFGANTITLTTEQIPVHTHNNILTFTDPEHFHDMVSSNTDAGSGRPTVGGGPSEGTNPVTNSKSTGITVSLANASAGEGQSHSNIQPVLATYYIIYLP